MEPLIIGGVKVYVPEQKGLFKKHKAKKLVEILPKEGDKNRVRVNGMLFEFPDQENIKTGQSSRPPFIQLYKDGHVDVMLKDAEITGSPKDDRVNSWCISSVFNFKDGGDDIIIHQKYNDNNYTNIDKNCKFNMNKNDYRKEYHRLFNEDGIAFAELIYEVTYNSIRPMVKRSFINFDKE